MADEERQDPRLDEADRLRYDGQYEEAIEHYNAILDDVPDCILARYGRALCYCFTGLFDESIEELEAIREAKPNLVKAREDLFKTYLMLGMNDEAKAEMRAVLEIDPGNAQVEKAAAYLPDFP